MDRMTDKQREFAEKHHDMVYAYLNHRNLPVEDFYDVAVMGYLRAVQNYLTTPRLRQYQFTTIAYNCMRSDVGYALRSEFSPKRNGRVVSLDQTVDDFTHRLRHETVSSDEPYAEDRAFDQMTEEDYLSQLTPLQQKIARLSLAGYSRKDVAGTCGISMDRLYRNLDEMRAALCRKLPEVAA